VLFKLIKLVVLLALTSCHIPMMLSNYQWSSNPTERKERFITGKVKCRMTGIKLKGGYR
jgi:hypothetical protein